MNEIIEIKQSDMLAAINKSETDIQITTAKAYPRNLQKVLNTIATYATMDKETAEECFYVLRRKGKNGQASCIEGLSVRMAEIIASAWGNLRIQTRIIGNDGREIVAQAVCHDLESNVAVCKEVHRSITDRNGGTYNQDMQTVTGNAASAIAFRNAVLSVIPKAVIKKVITDVKKVAMGQALDLEQSRANVIRYFNKLNVTTEQLLAYLEIDRIEDIDKQMIFELRGLRNAIEEGTTSIKETFEDGKATAKKSIAELAAKNARAARQAATVMPEPAEVVEAPTEAAEVKETIDTNTGEIKFE